MDPNTTPTSRRNRSSCSGTPQEESNLGFGQFQGAGYISRFQDPNNHFQQICHQRHIPYPFSYEALIAQGYRPAYFGNSSTQHQNEDDIKVEGVVPKTQQSNPLLNQTPRNNQP